MHLMSNEVYFFKRQDASSMYTIAEGSSAFSRISAVYAKHSSNEVVVISLLASEFSISWCCVSRCIDKGWKERVLKKSFIYLAIPVVKNCIIFVRYLVVKCT